MISNPENVTPILTLYINFPCSLGPGAPAAKYIGGEQRHDAAGNAAYVALAADCTGASVKDLVASHLLAKVLGNN